MPRDMDLIRELMLQFEQGDTSVPEGRAELEVAYHVKQLIDGGFVEGEVLTATTEASPGKPVPKDYFVHDITWKGHDFIKAVREATVWQQVKDHFRENAIPWTADLILEFLKQKGREALGL